MENLLQKKQQSESSKPEKAEDTALEKHEDSNETRIEEGPIADQAPFSESDPEDNSENHG